MRSRSKAALAALALALAGVAACESVPSIDFEVPDATADSGSAQLDQTAPPSDSGMDAPAADTGADASPPLCASPQPSGGTCCGAVWCVGQCDPTNCGLCAAKGCGGSDLCCGKMGTVQCKPQCP